jgi:hypothetical protein
LFYISDLDILKRLLKILETKRLSKAFLKKYEGKEKHGYIVVFKLNTLSLRDEKLNQAPPERLATFKLQAQVRKGFHSELKASFKNRGISFIERRVFPLFILWTI